ncbi:3'-5' exonuclease [Chloroflexota bacterium]|nr:3'-5' exonuclease [Chloroflexota bacterium]
MFPKASPKVVERAKQILAYDPVFIDTETTGFTHKDVVIEIGVVDLHGKTLYKSLFKPAIPIPPDSVAVHHITEEMVADAPSWKDAWEEMEPVLKGRLVGMYNAEFDLRMMKQTHERYWLDWPLDDRHFFCVMKLYAAFYGELSTRSRGYRLHKLEAAGAASGIPLPNSHRAVDDALLTAELFRYMANYS